MANYESLSSIRPRTGTKAKDRGKDCAHKAKDCMYSQGQAKDFQNVLKDRSRPRPRTNITVSKHRVWRCCACKLAGLWSRGIRLKVRKTMENTPSYIYHFEIVKSSLGAAWVELKVGAYLEQEPIYLQPAIDTLGVVLVATRQHSNRVPGVELLQTDYARVTRRRLPVSDSTDVVDVDGQLTDDVGWQAVPFDLTQLITERNHCLEEITHWNIVGPEIPKSGIHI